MVVATAELRIARLSAERRFFLCMAIALTGAVLLGFARSFFLRPFFPEWHSPHESIFYVHGTLFAGWLALLVTQASLVTGGRIDLHRRFGVFGACLAASMVVMGIAGALVAAHRPTGFIDLPVPPLVFLSVPLFDMPIFGVLVALAILKRNNPQAHKRLILMASVALVGASVARWPGLPKNPLVFFGISDLFLLPLVVWDLRTRGRLHPVTVWAGLCLVISQPLRLFVGGTAAWLAFAQWAVSFAPS
jgi:hypothetical protein